MGQPAARIPATCMSARCSPVLVPHVGGPIALGVLHGFDRRHAGRACGQRHWRSASARRT